MDLDCLDVLLVLLGEQSFSFLDVSSRDEAPLYHYKLLRLLGCSVPSKDSVLADLLY